MKRFFAIFALMFVVVATAPHAEAKRFGGGKSFGKSYKTAPAPKSQPQQNNLNKQQANPAKNGTKKGLMGGLLGGLLAGGLLAALFAGGAFEGLQFMDILIVAVIAFVLFKIFRSMMAAKNGAMRQQGPAMAGSAPSAEKKGYYHEKDGFQQGTNAFRETSSTEPAAPAGGFGSSPTSEDVPHNFPPNFDITGFVNGARDHYRTLQQAWNVNDLAKIQEYVTPELYNELSRERASMEGEQHTEVMFVDAEVVRADHDQSTAHISLKFSGRYRDSHEGVEEDITDIWHLERDLKLPNAPWLIVGIEL
ncbi:Tim44 domain-containing protein [Veronia pacifica]|uniref:Preprotein translocase subunit Tim44 n=1 Tax=Veronia pacifica TaxID=1080227 RepID=A0A1C3ERB8_9GAMM|nr:TIM44-like domain-containing protein [Veronia pacifica]ODA35795.1 preprotein translocase subunit Tim44 [Veronia pacifica]